MISSTMVQGFNRLIFSLKQASPEILLVGGVVGVVGSTVLACRATLKASDILDDHQENMETIHEAAEKADPEKYTQQDIRLDTTRTYAATAGAFIKAYAPAVILGALSIAAIISSHSIMRQRNLALTAALSSANAMFQEYRDRVKSQLGEDVDDRIYNGGKTVVKNGKGKKGVMVTEYKDRPLDPYARFFSEDDFKEGLLTTWKQYPGDNQTFLSTHETWLNQRLKWRGWMTLAEVYEDLGWKVDQNDARFEEYRNMGWTDDDFIDLGLHSPRCHDFMTDSTITDVWLTFNCHDLNAVRRGGKYIAMVS